MAEETKPPAAAPEAGVKVIPFKPIDYRPPVSEIRSIVFFVLPHILDEQLLRDSLDKLIRNHLPILGARVVKTPDPATNGKKPKGMGKWEYHYPETFPADAKLFSWSANSVSSTLAASKLLPDVSGTKEAIVWGRPIPEFEEQWTPTDWPREFNQDKPDQPLLLVHLTKYEDATVLSLNIPHSVVDQKGLSGIVESWLAVARGAEPPEFLELPRDALDGPADLPKSELRKKNAYRLKTKGEYIRSVMQILPIMLKDRKEERRTMFLSAAVVSRIRDECNKKLQEKYGAEEPLITNGDVVTSIAVKLVNYHRKKPAVVALGETINSRGLYPSLPKGENYLHNCPSYAYVPVKAGRDTPLVDIARQHRHIVLEGMKPEAVGRSFAVTKAVFDGGYDFPCGESGQLSYSVSNWSSVWHNLDFSPVIKGEAGPTQEPLLVLGHALQRSFMLHRYHIPIMSKAQGGYWSDFGLSAKTFAQVQELLKRDPLLETL